MTDTGFNTPNFGTRGNQIGMPSDPVVDQPAATPVIPDQQPGSVFGSGLGGLLPGPHYTPPDPNASPLDQTADTLQQRVKRANDVATNPLLQLFNPEGVQAARDFVPKATEQLQKIRQQKADMQANAVQAQTLGLAPGEVPDEATMADRVAVAQSKALKGDLRVFRGLQAVDPKSAEAIQDQVHEAVAGHLNNAQLAFDSLAGMQNEGQYQAKLAQLRKDGTISDLESLGLKAPGSFADFNAMKGREGRALREARIGVDTIRQKLEDRNTYQPMEEKEAKTYAGRMTTVYGDKAENGVWGRNSAAGTRGLIVNGAGDPRDLGKNFTLGTDEQRKSLREESATAVPKEDLEKQRAFNRTYQLATTDADGKPMSPGTINTNPNVQQGIAEGLASMLRGGSGGANVGLLKIESSKRAAVQNFIDNIKANYAGGINAISGKDVRPYLTNLTQSQIRDVMDMLKGYNDSAIGDRVAGTARRAGALGFDSSVLGLAKGENSAVDAAVEEGRQAQIARMMPQHQAIGGGDGVFQIGAQRPGQGATGLPQSTSPTTQLPGAQPLTTPVQQATQPPGPISPAGPTPPSGSAPAAGGVGASQTPPAGGGSPSGQPVTIAGQQVNVPLPPGASPNYPMALQRIESGNEKSPWTSTTPRTSAGGAFQFVNSTWAQDKPAGAPARAADATPAQQAQALATHTAKNAQSLTNAGLPVNDTNLYIAHNLGAGGAQSLLGADPSADARTIVGEVAARNNPQFFRGRPTVATVLGRYAAAMAPQQVEATPPESPKNPPSSGGAAAQPPGLLTRISRALSQGIPGGPEAQDAAVARVGNAAVNQAPAIGSTGGALIGSLGGPLGTIGGGAAGGGAGQALKDYIQGNQQSATKIAEQTALGGVLGVASEARPVLAAAGRVLGAGGVEGATKAAEGGNAADVVDATLTGAGAAAGGELFGRALGMAGHKLFSLFGKDAQQTVADAAKSYHEASETLKTEPPKLAGEGAGANPKYEAAQAAKDKAETVLKDAGLKPDEAAYAHKVSSEGVPRQEAEVSRPAELERQRIGAGYQQLEQEIGEKGVGAVKATPRQVPENSLQKIDEGSMRDGRQTVTYMAKTDSGNVVASFALNGKTAELRHIGMQGAGENEAANSVGAATMRGLLKDFQQLHPEVETIKANRFSGARTGGVYGGESKDISVKLPNGSMSAPHLQDGPMAAVANKKVSADHAELAERTEMAITAPAANWQEKWNQLKDARSALLEAERDALTSTAPGRTQTAKDMRTLADTVRAQQEKAANYVFGPKDGPAFMSRLKVLDTRYRNLMEATNNGDIARAATKTGAEGRAIDQKFRAFAHDDPTAIAAWDAMRGAVTPGGDTESKIFRLLKFENIPYIGKAAVTINALNEWMRERAAGSPVKFSDLVQMRTRPRNDVTGAIGARAATQGSFQ